MAREISGTGRVTVFPLLHLFPDIWGVAAYATTGHFGITAAVGYIPIPEVPDMSLLDVAARHRPANDDRAGHTEWVLCTAWSARTVFKPGSLDLPEAEWSLEWDTKSSPKSNGGNMYGHSELYTGRFSLADDVLMKQAMNLLPELARR